MFISSLLVYILNYSHFLIILLSLEMMVLSLFLLMFFYYLKFNMESFISMVFISVTVCESALGLSLLVWMIRTHGGDFVMLVDNLW
uniref:NADH-ubiquinone oxidoreductase chain 4L n=1 Tax=Trypodendron domesticum TaxID=1220309 RepID=A0A343A6E1_9CUCU|nr:NADH dehydrogenase subunit 4L [Trypodendron domesticum]AOY40120.1 NADH dehydrogenase subunit 4L [Trypodendron domesticum]